MELETAKEELQSTNEELATVNDELEHRNKELTDTNNDLRNLLSSVNLPIRMLDSLAGERQFSPRASVQSSSMRERKNLDVDDHGLTERRPGIDGVVVTVFDRDRAWRRTDDD